MPSSEKQPYGPRSIQRVSKQPRTVNRPADVITIGVDRAKNPVGLFTSDIVHSAVEGLTGSGKSTWLLSQIYQHVMNGDSTIVIDPHGDLVKKVLTMVPESRWNDVVYIDPITAFKNKRAVQVNLLEVNNELQKGIVERTFMDSLRKIYGKFWGPRLDMIMLNVLYALMEQPRTKLTDIYTMLVDEEARNQFLSNVTDQKVLMFWRNQYSKLPKDADSAVITKIYKIIQEKLIVPLFDCYESSINFRNIMDTGKIVLVNLSEGALTSDVADFVGALLLAKIYMAGMSREDIPEDTRKRCYLYIDEAHRFTTTSIKDILESLRKYRVYATLASQYLSQYPKIIMDAIPALCSTIVCFRTDNVTARQLEGFFAPTFAPNDVINLPIHWFVLSAPVRGMKEQHLLKTINIPLGKHLPDTVIAKSLAIYGKDVDVEQSANPVSPGMRIPYPPLDVSSWAVLGVLYFNQKAEWNREAIVKEMKVKTIEERDVNKALNKLVMDRYVTFFDRVEKSVDSGGKPHQETVQYYVIDHKGLAEFSYVPVGARGGGDRHLVMMQKYIEQFTRAGYYPIVDTGDFRESFPDLLVYPPLVIDGVTDPRQWDTPHRFAVEVEAEPEKHHERVRKNFEKNYNLGMPVLFVADSPERVESIKQAVGGMGRLVKNIMDDYGAGHIQVDLFVPVWKAVSDKASPEPVVQPAPYEKPPEQAPTFEGMRMSIDQLEGLLKDGWKPRLHKGFVEIRKSMGGKDKRNTIYVGKATPALLGYLEQRGFKLGEKGESVQTGSSPAP